MKPEIRRLISAGLPRAQAKKHQRVYRDKRRIESEYLLHYKGSSFMEYNEPWPVSKNKKLAYDIVERLLSGY